MKIVLAGSGQTVSHWTPEDGVEAAPSPTTLRAEAARRALGAVREVDALAVVRTTEDSIPTSPFPMGRDANPPGTLARDLGLTVKTAIYHKPGGQSPQELASEMANRIADGEFDSALVVGAEATAALKAATRAGLTLDWADDADMEFEDRGTDLSWVSPAELAHGLITPMQYYGLMERRLAHQMGHGRDAHRRAMAELFAPFSDVAHANPYSQFPAAHSVAELVTPSATNYPVADPYLKWHVAQDAVNQGAAVLLMSEAKADALGLGDRVYLQGGGNAADTWLSQRPDLARSRAMHAAMDLARGATGFGELAQLDLYSCFPVAVWNGLDALDDRPDIPLTVTGGLPFFGGPGNNYPLHAIAEMFARLKATDGTGLVLANGGWTSKEAVGIYSGAPVEFVPVETAPTPTDIVELVPEGQGGIETYTFTRSRDGSPKLGTAFVRASGGERILATVSGDALSRLADLDDASIGAPVTVTTGNGVGQLAFEG